METRNGNRLCPQSMLTNHNVSGSSANTVGCKSANRILRRRCRSECLQMTPLHGISTKPKLFDDLNDLQIQQQQQQQPQPQQQQQNILRNMWSEYSSQSPAVLRNQERAKNISTNSDLRSQNRQQNGTVTLKNSTKENFSSVIQNNIFTINGSAGNLNSTPHHLIIPQNNNHHQCPLIVTTLPTLPVAESERPNGFNVTNSYENGVGVVTKDYTMNDSTTSPHKLERTIKSTSQQDIGVPKIQLLNRNGYEQLLVAVQRKYMARGTDNHQKRRVRSRSESEHDNCFQLTHQSTQKTEQNVVLKRSREDKSTNHQQNSGYSLHLSPQQLHKQLQHTPRSPPIASVATVAAAAAAATEATVQTISSPLLNIFSTDIKKSTTLSQPSSSSKPPLPVANPKHTKITNQHLPPRPCTPRYPIKPLNGLRKLKSRTVLSKSRTKVSMVVSVKSSVDETTCQNIKTETATTEQQNGSSSNSVAGGGGGGVGGEESDTGCSSLDDDDDLDDLGDGDFNDSLSDSEDSSSLLGGQLTSLDQKLSDGSIEVADCVLGQQTINAPFSASLFPFVPPYISFATHLEKGPAMPAAVTKILKWKLTTITPIVIRKVLVNSGFRLLRHGENLVNEAATEIQQVSNDDHDDIVDETNDWMGVWGKHMKSPCFKTVRSFQKINHIPGTFQIGRKDRVWRNLQVQMARHGKKQFGFMPRTYIIPYDLNQLRKVWPRYSQRNIKWIIKPPASARGTGIKVVNRWSQIPKRKPLIVQRYVERPLLINGSKFDLRLYVLITSINPLRVYMHTDGLARFASVKYSEKSDTLHDRYMHLTNYSINKLSTNYSKNEDANACKGHKWTLKSLWTHLSAKGVDVNRLWGALRNLVLNTILAGENAINQVTKLNVGSKYNCYELFGIDVILDSELKPWLLEVNISPSLHSASPLDLHVKGPLVQALFNTVMFQVPPRLPLQVQQEITAEHGLSGNLCYDKRMYVTNLSKEERAKHAEFTGPNIINREDYLTRILRNLTPDDVRCLMISEDELNRSAPLERIFPTPSSHKYLKFNENPRYYNRLLDAWEHRYGGTDDNSLKREDGIAMLRKFCQNKFHLIVPPPPVKKDSESNANSTTADITTAETKSISVNVTENSPPSSSSSPIAPSTPTAQQIPNTTISSPNIKLIEINGINHSPAEEDEDQQQINSNLIETNGDSIIKTSEILITTTNDSLEISNFKSEFFNCSDQIKPVGCDDYSDKLITAHMPIKINGCVPELVIPNGYTVVDNNKSVEATKLNGSSALVVHQLQSENAATVIGDQ